MRRKDREIKEPSEILEIMKRCAVLDVAFFDEEYPYIVPFNFGLVWEGELPILYIHGAAQGKKFEMMEKNPHVSFCMRTGEKVLPADVPCAYSCAYQSVCGNGIASMVPMEQKKMALDAIMSQAGAGGDYTYPQQMLERIGVWQIQVVNLTAKATFKD